MDRLLALVLLVAGCAPAPPTLLAGGGAVLSTVAADQQYVAVLASSMTVPGARIGALQAVPTAGGTPITLEPSSVGGTYNRGTTLWFLGSINVVTEGTTAAPVRSVYGVLRVWRPGMAAAATVGNDVREYYVSSDGSTCVFIDWDQPTTAATNTGKLVAVAASSCASGTCQPIVLATGITLAQAGWRISSDGKSVLAAVRGALPTDAGRVLLVSLESSRVQTLSTAVGTRLPMMTPAGDTIAWVEGTNRLVVAGTPGPIQAFTTTSPNIESAVMVDAANFVVKTREAPGPTGTLGAATFVKLSAAGEKPLPVPHPLELFLSQSAPRYLFFSQNVDPNFGQHDLWLLDLVTANAQPVLLGGLVDTPVGGGIFFSDDASTIHFLDNYNPANRRGDDYVVTLAKPARSLVQSFGHNGGFIPGSTRYLYINAPDQTSNAGVLTLLPAVGQPTLIEGVGELNFVNTRAAPLRTYYTQSSGASDDGVWYMPRP
jgi:hypothetical protein